MGNLPTRRRLSSSVLLLLGLLLTNALVYLWGVALQPPPQNGDPLPPLPDAAAPLALLDDGAAAPAAPAPSSEPVTAARPEVDAPAERLAPDALAARDQPRGLAACLTWGPYTERKPLDDALAELEPFLRNHEIRQAEVNDQPDYLVFVGARGSRNRARQILEELKSQNIDSAIIRLDDDNAISVGVFSQPRRAERQQRRVSDLGYEVEIRELTRTHEVFQLIGWPRAGTVELPRPADGYCDAIAQGSGFL